MINSAARTAARSGPAKRTMSAAAKAEPKMHKADAWKELTAKRPVDPHPHPTFEPPYNKVGIACGVVGVITAGYGSMYFGMRHQQYKQGYWK
mmetsp:Transcript_2022/g.3212  ORF Transcript_2022/g.3212 Transcript_2022/m.3212 type:complete len:92 (-) Transcript_2022:302-577(-)